VAAGCSAVATSCLGRLVWITKTRSWEKKRAQIMGKDQGQNWDNATIVELKKGTW